jgi:hypothetical protein
MVAGLRRYAREVDSRMIRITLERPGREAGRERVLVREFDDHYEAASWFIHDSYFEQPYTAKAVWEVVHQAASAPEPSSVSAEEELPERWRGDPEGFERWLERTGYYEAG